MEDLTKDIKKCPCPGFSNCLLGNDTYEQMFLDRGTLITFIHEIYNNFKHMSMPCKTLEGLKIFNVFDLALKTER